MIVSVIVPVFNEVENIAQVIRAVQAVPVDKEIIVVDDGSTDGTRDVLTSISGITTIFHRKNEGKGSAIRSGLKIATGEVIIIQDADLEYSPAQYPCLLEPIHLHKTRVVYGSRILGKGEFLVLSYLANRFLTLLTNLLYSARITDMETCYKAVDARLFKELGLVSSRFEIEPEITCKILRRNESIYEVPISYHGRRKGKKIGPVDGLQAIWNLVKWKIRK
ncbi:MAG: glycosyltransferase family 2 protein [candidate division WOR-3 bacterium]|nr:MAG: glycosyltransferase family 2 protein [candidate division WOR-3 bacterium]